MCLTVAKTSKDRLITTFERENVIPAEIKLLEFIHVSKKPIKVYKYFTKDFFFFKGVETLRWKTPFQGTEVSMRGDVMTTKEFFSCEYQPIYDGSDVCLRVSKGIHSFISSSITVSLATMPNTFMIKCFIPPYTPFIYGKMYDIVSLQLVIPPITQEELKTELPIW